MSTTLNLPLRPFTTFLAGAATEAREATLPFDANAVWGLADLALGESAADSGLGT
jgi:hypothetical protein